MIVLVADDRSLTIYAKAVIFLLPASVKTISDTLLESSSWLALQRIVRVKPYIEVPSVGFAKTDAANSEIEFQWRLVKCGRIARQPELPKYDRPMPTMMAASPPKSTVKNCFIAKQSITRATLAQ